MNREYYLGNVYGISVTDYQDMMNSQDGKCAICGVSGVELHVDHNHDTGSVRALLCFQCNTGLGMFKDNPDLLRKAAVYLIDTEIRIQSNETLGNGAEIKDDEFPKDWRTLESMLTQEDLEHLANLNPQQVRELANVVGVTEKTITNWRSVARQKLGE